MSSKPHIKKIIVSDKIYFKSEDVLNMSEEKLIEYFTFLLKTSETICTLHKQNQIYAIPSNAWWRLDYDEFEDLRSFPILDYSIDFKAQLRKDQQDVANKFLNTKNGIIRSGIYEAPPGFGKTFIGCYLASKAKTKCLFLVHTKLLFYQWKDEILKQLGISVGLVGDGYLDIKDFTVGLYRSVNSNIDSIRNNFGLTIVDECHKAPANLYQETLNNINSRIKIGVSATPYRKDGKHVILPEFFTPFKVIAQDPTKENRVECQIIKTDIPLVVRQVKKDWARAINAISMNPDYRRLLIEKITKDIHNGRCPLILSDRVNLLKYLNSKIPQAILIIGETPSEERNEVLKQIGSKYKAILSTRIFDEGISSHRLDTLHLTTPSNNHYNLKQRIGRIQREHPQKQHPKVVDYWFTGWLANKQQANRLSWYKGWEFSVNDGT